MARSAQHREQQAERAAQRRDQHAFGDELTDHVAAAGAEREARRDFLAAARQTAPAAGSRCSRTRSAARSRPRRTASGSSGAARRPRPRAAAPPRCAIGASTLRGVRLPVAGRDHVHRLARLLERDAGLETRDHLEEEAAVVQSATPPGTALPPAAAPRRRNPRSGNDEARSGSTPITVYGAPSSVIAWPTIDASPLKRALPEALADDRHALAARTIFIRRKVAAQHRLDARSSAATPPSHACQSPARDRPSRSG